MREVNRQDIKLNIAGAPAVVNLFRNSCNCSDAMIVSGVKDSMYPQDHTCLARFTKRASSSPVLLALLPLRDDVLRERQAPLRLDAQAAGLVMGVYHKNKRIVSSTREVLFDPARLGRQACDRLLVHVTLVCPRAYPLRELTRRVLSGQMTQGLPVPNCSRK